MFFNRINGRKGKQKGGVRQKLNIKSVTDLSYLFQYKIGQSLRLSTLIEAIEAKRCNF